MKQRNTDLRCLTSNLAFLSGINSLWLWSEKQGLCSFLGFFPPASSPANVGQIGFVGVRSNHFYAPPALSHVLFINVGSGLCRVPRPAILHHNRRFKLKSVHLLSFFKMTTRVPFNFPHRRRFFFCTLTFASLLSPFNGFVKHKKMIKCPPFWESLTKPWWRSFPFWSDHGVADRSQCLSESVPGHLVYWSTNFLPVSLLFPFCLTNIPPMS